MKAVKQILKYLIWIAIALLLGVCHILILFGPKESSAGLLGVANDMIYLLGMLLGLKIGVLIALVFILADVFYLKKKLKEHKKSTIIRFVILVAIAVIIGATHYILEKVIDVI